MKIIFLVFLALILSACGGGGGASTSKSEDTANSRVIASYSKGSSYFYFNPPNLSGDFIYIGTSSGTMQNPASDNYVIKLNKSMAEIWSYALGTTEVLGNAALDSNGNIYFIAQEGRSAGELAYPLFVYSLTNEGKHRWKKSISNGSHQFMNIAVTSDNIIYAMNDKLYAFEENGNEKWVFSLPDGLPGFSRQNSPIIDSNGNLYFASYSSDSNVHAISVNKNGVLRWRAKTSSIHFYGSPALNATEKSVFYSLGNSVYKIDTLSGTITWKYQLDNNPTILRSSPILDANENVYIGSKNGNNSIFYAIKSDGVGLLWETKIGADIYSTATMGSDNSLYFGSESTASGDFHAINSATGAVRWSTKTSTYGGSINWSSPAISPDGYAYIGESCIGCGGGAKLLKIKTDSSGLLSSSGWPKLLGRNEVDGRRK